MGFPIGTRCIVSGLTRDVEYNGVTVVVTSDPRWDDEDMEWEQSAETEGRIGDSWSYRIRNLYPIEDDKDSANASEVVDWGDCVWQPASIPVTQ
jgi:hypothetical protein